MITQQLLSSIYQGKVRSTTAWAFILIIYTIVSACALVPSTERVAAVESDVDYQAREYHIQPEDLLEISVWREETLQREVLVRPDGGISFPLAGDLQAAGKTVQQLEAEITQRLRKYIPEPTVTVSVAKVAGYRIYVLGQVKDPGQYVVGRYVDVLQALTLAGGLTPYASEGNIKILRRENNEELVFPFSYAAVKKGQDLEQNIMLKSDDVVVVP